MGISRRDWEGMRTKHAFRHTSITIHEHCNSEIDSQVLEITSPAVSGQNTRGVTKKDKNKVQSPEFVKRCRKVSLFWRFRTLS